MRTVILDGYTLNPGDLSWAELEKYGEVMVYPRTAADEVASRLRDAEATLTNKVAITAETIAACPKLKYIGVTATGYNMIDMTAARGAGITVTTVPGYGTESVAQAVFALLLEITHQIGHHAQRVKEGAWTACPDFSFVDFPLRELAGSTMGIVGFGAIGQAVGRIAHAFQMRVIYHNRTARPFDAYPAQRVELADLFREADVVSLHCPLTPETKKFIEWPLLKTMKPSAILLNTARGGLLNEADVARALHENVIGWAGLDVLSTEPPAADNPLLSAPRCFIVPHLAWATVAARHRLMSASLANFTAYQQGKPRNVVS